ncbi:MAG: hypothetical protein HW382_1150 [Deltaproteobacteria bacterium]|nr:hypothetical protein [Deltaproteobacteria bacterium]
MSKKSLFRTADFNFSQQIAAKYTIFRKSANLLVLVFFRLFGTRVMNTITRNNFLESKKENEKEMGRFLLR